MNELFAGQNDVSAYLLLSLSINANFAVFGGIDSIQIFLAITSGSQVKAIPCPITGDRTILCVPTVKLLSVKFLVVATETPSTNHSNVMLGSRQPSAVVLPCNPKFEVLVKVTLAPKQALSGAVKSNLGFGKI